MWSVHWVLICVSVAYGELNVDMVQDFSLRTSDICWPTHSCGFRKYHLTPSLVTITTSFWCSVIASTQLLLFRFRWSLAANVYVRSTSIFLIHQLTNRDPAVPTRTVSTSEVMSSVLLLQAFSRLISDSICLNSQFNAQWFALQNLFSCRLLNNAP